MKLSNKAYDVLKSLSLVWLPALVTLILALGKLYNIPYTEIIAGTITAIATFLGNVLQGSTKKYWEEIEENG